MKKILLILILSLCIGLHVKAQDSLFPNGVLEIREIEPKSDIFLRFLDYVLFENSKCKYLEINPEYYFKVGFQINDKDDTLVIVQSIMHDPTAYHEILKPDVVIIHKGIRFFIRYTGQYEKEIVQQKFNLKETYYPWKGSNNRYPLKMRTKTTVIDDLYIEAIISEEAIKAVKLVNCE